jgi:hypothetical protein
VANEEAERKATTTQLSLSDAVPLTGLTSSMVAHLNTTPIQTKGNISPNNIEMSKKSEITTVKSKWKTLKFNLSRNESLAYISKCWMLQKLLIAIVR